MRIIDCNKCVHKDVYNGRFDVEEYKCRCKDFQIELTEDLLQEIINQYLDYLNNTFAYDLVKETTKDLAKYMLAMLKYKNKLQEVRL